MTSKTSLFNLGLYINNLKRFKWGSILYFIMLFFSVPYTILVTNYQRLYERFISLNVPYLFKGDVIILPVLFALVIPTIVAVLIFNSVHSSKQSVFIHALPTDRRENYITQLCAGFTLMGVPVILNGLILLVMSFGKYGGIISSSSVIYWVLTNLAVLMIMFSLASFTAFLTGNAITHIILNIFIHTIPMIIALIIALICEHFLYGYIESGNSIPSLIMEYTPVVWIFGRGVYQGSTFNYIFKDIAFWYYVLLSVILYAGGFLLYKNRKMELSGDVVAFKIFRPIFKYSLCVTTASLILGIVTQTGLPAFSQFVFAVAGIFIVYFGTEMFMNKSFKVFRLYKGFIAFLIISGLFISFFAFTNVFGYETYIPDIDEIEKASVHNTWGEDIPLITDEKLIKDTVSIHNEFLENIPVTEPEYFNRSLKITYVLKNGKTVERYYRTNNDTYDNALRKMYENSEYKYKVTGIDNLNIENISNITLYSYQPLLSHNINITEDADKFMELVKKDIELLGYDELMKFHNPVNYTINIDITKAVNDTSHIFKERIFETDTNYDHYVYSFGLELNSNFENAFNFLKEKGYYKKMTDIIATSCYISKEPHPIYDESNELYNIASDYDVKYPDVTVEHNIRLTPDDLIFIEYNDAVKLTDEILFGSKEEIYDQNEYYFIFIKTVENDDNLFLGSASYKIKKDALPDYLTKYID